MPRIVVRKGYRCLPGKRRELLAALQRVDSVAAEAGWPRGRYLFVETKAPGEPDVEVEFTFESYGEMEQLERRLREHLGRAARDAASIGSAGQEFLLEPSSTRFLLLLDDATATAQPRRIAETRSQPTATPAPQVPHAGPTNPVPAPPPAPSQPAIQRRQGAGGYSGGAPAPPAGGAADRIRPAAPGAATSGPGGGRLRPVEPPPPPAPPDEGDEGFFDEPEPEPDLSPAERRLRQLAQARAALDSAERTVNVSPEQRTRARQITQREPQDE